MAQELPLTKADAPEAARPTTMPDREDLLRPLPKVTLRGVIIAIIVCVVYWWGVQGTNARPSELIEGIPNIVNFLVRLLPPNFDMQPVARLPLAITLPFTVNLGVSPVAEDVEIDPAEIARQLEAIQADPSNASLELGLPGASAEESDLPFFSWQPSQITHIYLPGVMPYVIETLQIAIIGTTISILLSVPFGLLAARNISPHPLVYQLTRLVMNAIRAVPELIFALVFVAAVGLGPFAGVLALAIGAIGFMAKLYAESIEQIDPQQVMALRATGASRLQVFNFSVIPQVLPLAAAYSLQLFEHNVRAATILGLVGAGGVGFILQKYMALFQYRELMGAVIILIIAVTIIDRVSDRIRKKII
jgi:phosphonate transport system permease protein